MTRRGGFAPAQLVLSRLPRSLATMSGEDECLDVGALQAHAGGPATFGVQSRYRAKAREAFVRWGCGERVRRATFRKAAPRGWLLPSWRRSLVLQRSMSW